MARKAARNLNSYNEGLEAAALMHDYSAEQYNRCGGYIDAAGHLQWAWNIRHKNLPKNGEHEGCIHPRGRVMLGKDTPI